LQDYIKTLSNKDLAREQIRKTAKGWKYVMVVLATSHGFGNDGRALYFEYKIRATRRDAANERRRCKVVGNRHQLCNTKRNRPLYGTYSH